MPHYLSTTFTNEELRTFYSALLIKRATPEIVHGKFGQRVSVPLHYGPTISFRAFENITATTTPLTQGTAGASTAFSISVVTTSLPEYGQWVEGTQRLQDLAVDDIIANVTEKLGEAAGNSLDQVTRAVLRSGTNVVYGASQAATNKVASLLTVKLLKQAVFTLKKGGAKPFVFGGKRRYVGIISPEALYDLTQDTTLATAMQYGYGQNLGDNEANLIDGIAPELDIMGVRLFETTNASAVYASSGGLSYAHVYCTLLFGQDAYGVVEQDANSMKHYYIPANTPDKNDVLQQNWYLGWKAVHNAVILNQANMVRIEHTLSGEV